ncbi:hypothetical protein N7G274_000780 [Stereocaulon virgatum]|uniref:Uncharacterized protein n=1 Tax=Stereocaulon virgatum TaxID=373712 RepID=A0ABR4AW77_9LECA
MDSNSYQTPDLASVLRTLAAHAPAPPRFLIEQEKTAAYQAEAQDNDAELEDGEYDPSAMSYETLSSLTPRQYQDAPRTSQANDYGEFVPPITAILERGEYSTPAQQPPHLQKAQPSPQRQPANTTTSPPAKQISALPQNPPATIITWAPALRHITTVTNPNQEFTHRIKHLIRTQHQHEQQWWTAREDLVKRLHGRAASRSKLDSVLSSLGGKTAPLSQPDLPPEKEMEIYDKKVYRACREMAAATRKELAKLEVPFFCTTKGLVSGKRRKGTITEEELVGLQKRMLELLEDLCGGEE